ncbi:MAG: hypothetical protein WCJ58_04160 [bacterium]
MINDKIMLLLCFILMPSQINRFLNKIQLIKIANHWYYLAICLYFIGLVIVLPHNSSMDTDYWYRWTDFALQKGIISAYRLVSDLNYLPVTIYYLMLIGKFITTFFGKLNDFMYIFKAFFLIFDFLTFLFLTKFLLQSNSKHKVLKLIFLMGNIALIYNSYFWGQVDAIYTLFLLISIYLAYQKKYFWSLILFQIALNFKLQSIMIFPLIAILNFDLLKDYKKILKIACFAVLLQIVLWFPFIVKGELGRITTIINDSNGYFERLSLNAFNFWYLILPENIVSLGSDRTNKFLWINAHYWGFAMFFSSCGILLWKTFTKLKNRKFTLGQVYLIAALLNLFFFFFNTEMHERYSHPAMIFMAAFFVLDGSFLLSGLISFTYFLSLNILLRFFTFQAQIPLLVNHKFIAWLYLFILIYAIFLLWKSQKILVIKPHPEKISFSKASHHA